MRKTLFLILVIVLFLALVPIAYSVACKCSIYNSDEGFNLTQVDFGVDTCSSSCYESDGRLKQICYGDGEYAMAFECEAGNWVDCGMSSTTCSHSNRVKFGIGRSYSGIKLRGFLIARVSKDGEEETFPAGMALQQCSSFLNGDIDNNPVVFLEDMDAGYKCCGDDDEEDSGMLSVDPDQGKFLCSSVAGTSWQWRHVNVDAYSIFHIEKGNFDVVSNNIQWAACDAKGDGTENFNTDLGGIVLTDGDLIVEDRFICYNDYAEDIERIGECAGNEAPWNQNPSAGMRYYTGDMVFANDKLYFCSSTYRWVESIDNPETCEAAGNEWTGSTCCGDTYIQEESYNDDAWRGNPLAYGYTIGGCFQNTKVRNNTRISDGNFIKNHDFSIGLSNWIVSGNYNLLDRALQLSGSNSYASQSISGKLMPGQEYRLSAEILDLLGTGSNAFVAIYVNNELYTPSQLYTTSKEFFETVSIIFTAPEDTENVVVRIATPSGASGYAIFKNINLNFNRDSIMNYGGSFYGCNLSDEELAILDTNTGEALIPEDRNFVGTCSIFGDFFCSSAESSWGNKYENIVIEGGSDYTRDIPSSVPESYILPQCDVTGCPKRSSCCPQDYCWNGTYCIPSENNVVDPLRPLYSGDMVYRCISGAWEESILQWTWDRSDFGYCPTETQCLVDKAGSAESNNKPERYGVSGFENPQCIESGQFIGDHLCQNAGWTSRTKDIALQMLDLVNNVGSEDEYNLYCDYYEESLAEYDYGANKKYIVGELHSPETLLSPAEYRCPGKAFGCVNNFCILRYIDGGEEMTVIGTSLNTGINDPDYSFLNLVNRDKDYCTWLIGDGNDFSKCSAGDDYLWYSDRINAVIFSNRRISLGEVSWWDAFISFVKHPIQSMLGWVTGQEIIAPPVFVQDFNFTKNTKDFNRIYLAAYDDRYIKGVIETPEPNRQFMALNYTNFADDICKSARVYADAHPSEIGYTYCNTTGNSQYIVSYQPDVLAIWQHFTSRIRIR